MACQGGGAEAIRLPDKQVKEVFEKHRIGFFTYPSKAFFEELKALLPSARKILLITSLLFPMMQQLLSAIISKNGSACLQTRQS